MGHQIISDDAEEIKLKVPEAPAPIPALRRRFTPSDSSEFSTSSRKLRVTMNKVTDENFQKLVAELTETLNFDEKLLNEFLRLLFDRVHSKDFSELYLNILTYFTILTKTKDFHKFKVLKQLLKAKAEMILHPIEEFSLPSIRFLAHLYTEEIINCKTLCGFLDVGREMTENRVEAICVMLSIVSPFMVKRYLVMLEKVFAEIEAVPVLGFKRKVQFLVQEVLEQKQVLLTPVEHEPKFSDLQDFGLKRKVSFMTCGEFQPVVSKGMKRILKHSVSEVVKNQLKAVVAEYVMGRKGLEPFQKIFEECKNQDRQLVNQIFKYALIQFNREQEFLIICEMVCGICERIVKREVVETGIVYTVEAVDDLKLDTPMADLHLMFMIRYLKEHGVIENSQYLLDHLSRPIQRKQSESNLEGGV